MLGRATALLGAAIITASALPTMAQADPVDCQHNPMSGSCGITVDPAPAPGTDPAPAPGGSGGGGSSQCTHDGQVIPCTKGAATWFPEHGCYAIPWTGASTPPPGEVYMVCLDALGQPGMPFAATTSQVPPPPPDPQALARRAIAQMGLRHVGIGMAPPPGSGKVGVIGLPTWMWVADPGPQTTGPQTITVSERGYSVTATATMTGVRWAMGDGQDVVCGKGTPYSTGQGASPSPDCGYYYQRSGDYTVTAASSWRVDWDGIGQSGSIPLTFTSSTPYTEAELQAIGQK